MSVEEIGTYLRGKIRENGLKVGVVQRAAGVGDNYIWRLETGKMKKPSLTLLKALTEAVRGQWADVQVYLHDLPDLALADETSTHINTVVEETPPDDLAVILNEIRAEGARRPGIARALGLWLDGWRARDGDDQPHQ